MSIYYSQIQMCLFALFPFYGQLARFRKSCFSMLANYINHLKLFSDGKNRVCKKEKQLKQILHWLSLSDCLGCLNQKISCLLRIFCDLKMCLKRRKAGQIFRDKCRFYGFGCYFVDLKRLYEILIAGNNAYKLANFIDWDQQGYFFVSSNFSQYNRSTLTLQLVISYIANWKTTACLQLFVILFVFILIVFFWNQFNANSATSQRQNVRKMRTVSYKMDKLCRLAIVLFCDRGSRGNSN